MTSASLTINAPTAKDLNRIAEYAVIHEIDLCDVLPHLLNRVEEQEGMLNTTNISTPFNLIEDAYQTIVDNTAEFDQYHDSRLPLDEYVGAYESVQNTMSRYKTFPRDFHEYVCLRQKTAEVGDKLLITNLKENTGNYAIDYREF